jgi:hypothetical protein
MNFMPQFVMSICLCFSLWGNVRVWPQQKTATNAVPTQTPNRPPVSSRELLLTVIYEDGQALELTNPVLGQKSLWRDRYTGRYYGSEISQGIRLRKVTANRGVTTVDTKDIHLSDMRTIEFLKNAKSECIILITLRDGRKILTSDNYVVSKEKWPEGVTPSPEFEGY